MLGRRKRKYEQQRTCRRCSTVWHVSSEAAIEAMNTPGRLEKFAANARATGDRLAPGGWRGAGELQLLNLNQRRARAEAINSCPNCGSQSFTQVPVEV